MKSGVFTDIQAYAQDLAQEHGERDTLLREMEKIYLLEWGEQKKLEQQFAHMYITKSPAARNAIKTAVRLMTASYPNFNVPRELQDDIGADVADGIEKMAAVMVRASDRILGQPLHFDATTSGLLYDEIHISVNNTADLLEYANGGSKAQIARVKRIADMTPFLFKVHNPIGCYPDFDYMGLRAWARKVSMNKGEILDRFGAAGQQALSDAVNKGALDTYDVWTYWDVEYYACWLDGSSTPIHFEPHGLPIIPVSVHYVEGSRLFSDLSDQREPFLYTLWASGLWNRQNLLLSAMYTTGGMALWPQLVYSGPEGTEPQIDLSNPFGYITVPPGTSLDTWRKNLIDPALPQLWQLSEQLGTESTIYKQVAGGGLGAGDTFSAISLLNQSGRLPLVSVQRKAGWAIGDALKIAFAIMREEGGKWHGKNTGVYAEVKAAEIPETLEIEVTLDASLPQDKLQQANIFNILQGKLPQEWLMENILNVRQPGELTKQLMAEQATAMEFQAYLQQKMAEKQAQAQAMQAQMQQLQSGPTETMSNPMQGGLPPEMMAGGTQGPRGATGTPEEGMYASELP